MKLTPTIFLGSFGALAATFALAQESPSVHGDAPVDAPVDAPGESTPAESTGVPLRPFADAGEPRDLAPSNATFDDLDVAARLSVDDLDAREAAFDEIARLAARDWKIRQQIKDLSEDAIDLDLAFTARLVLREADRMASWGRAGSGFGGNALQSPNDPHDAMRQRMESIFGADPFVDDFFSNDPFFSRPFGGRSGMFGVDPFSGGRDPFEEMQRRAEDLRKQFEEMHGRAGKQPSVGQGGAQGNGFGGRNGLPGRQNSSFAQKSSSMSMSSTPDGVRVEITEDDGTGAKTRTYEGPSVEALLEAHPELKGRIR